MDHSVYTFHPIIVFFMQHMSMHLHDMKCTYTGTIKKEYQHTTTSFWSLFTSCSSFIRLSLSTTASSSCTSAESPETFLPCSVFSCSQFTWSSVQVYHSGTSASWRQQCWSHQRLLYLKPSQYWDGWLLAGILSQYTTALSTVDWDENWQWSAAWKITNHRSSITDAMNISTYRINGLRKGDKYPPILLYKQWYPLPFYTSAHGSGRRYYILLLKFLSFSFFSFATGSPRWLYRQELF